MKKILLIAAALLLASSCVAQNTSVTATVTSPNGYVWAQATYTVTLVPYVIGSISLLNGAQFTQTYSGTLNSSGQLSITLADNNIVTPSGSQWRFNLCAAAGVPCIQAQTTITGTSMSLTALLSSLAPNPYNNVVPNPQPGTATIKPFPSNAAGIVVVANTNQTSPLAIFAKPTGSLGLAITPSCILFSDASSQCTAATFNGLAPPASTGSLLYASGANIWSALGIGTANSILTSNGTLPGWSSSVISSINDTGGQVFNVKAYGATGNGTTNDKASIDAAVNAAKSVRGTVYFPPGTYAVNAPENFTALSGIQFLGPQSSGWNTKSAVINYTGSALSGTCPFEFENDYGLTIRGLNFSSTNSVACIALFGSAGGESFHIDLIDDGFLGQTATVTTVANFGAENLSFIGNHTDIIYGSNGNRGVLISSNGGSGYGIASNFGDTFSPNSTTGYYFGPNIVFDGYGTGRALELDGTGEGIAFVRGSAPFFQINETGTGATGIYVRGVVADATFSSPRCESDAGSNTSYFIQASSATLENWYIDGLNQASGCGIALYSASSSTLSGARISGDEPAINWTGNIIGLDLKSYSSMNITVTGNLTQSRLDDFTGSGSTAISVSGLLNADIDGLKNVVWWSRIASGSSTYTFPTGGFVSGLVKASFNSSVCEFLYANGSGAGAGSFYTVGTVSSAIGYSGAQTLTCPSAGSTSSPPSISATYTNTGGVFEVQEF